MSCPSFASPSTETCAEARVQRFDAKRPLLIRDFLAAALVDHMHVVVVPIVLGRGVRLWDGLVGLENDYEVEAISSPSGVTQVTFTRAGV